MKYDRFDDKQKKDFSVAVRQLLKEKYVLKTTSEDTYLFILLNRENVNEILHTFGYELNYNENFGVIGLKEYEEEMKYSLRKVLTQQQSAILAVLMRLYAVAVSQKGHEKSAVYVDFSEVLAMADEWNVIPKEGLSMNKWTEILTVFKSMNLIYFTKKDVVNMETEIHLLPSLTLVLDIERLNKLTEMIKKEYAEDV